MWRNSLNNSRPDKIKAHNSRWRLIVAIVFLFSGSLVYKLFSLQIGQCDMYTAMAANQQQISSQLKPERGKIFVTEKVNGVEKLYPIATNKDLAVLYAVPKDVVNPRELAEKFYEFFDKARIEEELSKTASGTEQAATTSHETILTAYLKRFDKPGDVYEPLEGKKINTETLLKLYAFLGSTSTSTLTAANLEITNARVFIKKTSGDASSTAVQLKIPGLGFDLENFRYYPENEIASNVLGFVSYTNGEGTGKYGLEEFFNEDLFGKYGSLKSEKGGQGSVIIVNDREYVKPVPGSDLILTLDRNVEFVACEKLKETVDRLSAEGGSVIVINPKTGAIIAMCSYPNFNPNDYKKVDDLSVYNNPATFNQYEPGSVFKTITMAIAIDQKKVAPSTLYKDEGQIMINGWNKPIKNADFSTNGPHGIVDMNTVLDYSLNTGAIFAMRQVGTKTFADYIRDFGFGERTGIELGAESTGNIGNLLTNKVREIDAATASFGQGISVTPLQMVMTYQALANKGVMMKPYIVQAIVREGQREETVPKPLRQVVSAKTADTISAMLVNVVEKGHSKRAHIDGYFVGGKTGTAQVAEIGGYSTDRYIHTFVGSAPVDDPAFVMLTKIDAPKGIEFAEGSALPLWTEVADYMLKYYQIPKTRK